MALPEEAAALCDRCLGRRIVGAAGTGPQQEAAILARRAEGWAEVAEADCPICEGAFFELDAWVETALEAAAPYEFATFQVGTVFSTEGETMEKSVAAAMGMESVGETIRTEANRALAAAIGERTGTGTAGEGERPDLALLVDTRFWTCEARANSTFILGRYTKTRRDIPQTHWPCKRCQGRGCWECDDVGVMYQSSVEDAIAAAAIPRFGAEGASFHGAGREDIDALMLGTGRPFVLELHDPKRRTTDLLALETEIGTTAPQTGVGVLRFVHASKPDVARIKEADYNKEYLAHCETESPLTRSAVEAICQQLTGITLDQRTPERVSHRRADLIRKRTVHHVKLEAWDQTSRDAAEGHVNTALQGSQEPQTISPDKTPDPVPPAESRYFSLRVLAESGTYIKEMVSGDDGRTTPSFASLAGTPTRVAYLDVVAILDDA